MLQHLLAIGHLRHGLWRDEAHGIDVLEPGAHERAQVSYFQFRRNLSPETLPGVAGAFDQFYSVVRHSCGLSLEKFFCAFEKALAQRSVLLTAKLCEFLKLATLFSV